MACAAASHAYRRGSDGTFGPQLVYIKAPTKEQGQKLSPAFDLQFVGHVAIDGETERATATLYDWNNVALWSKILDPRQAAPPVRDLERLLWSPAA